MELGNGRHGGTAYYTALFLNAFITLSLGTMLQLALAAQYTGQARLNLSLLVLALFLLPLVLLPRFATSVCRRFGALDTLRRGAWGLLAVTVVAALSHAQGWLPGAWLLTAAGAAQAAFVATAKYSFLKPRAGVEHLSEANGYVSAVTAAALVLASINTSFSFELLHTEGAPLATAALQSLAPLSWLLVVCALLELGILYRLCATTPPEPSAPNEGKDSSITRTLWQSNLRIGALGLAWLWAVGLAVLLATPRYLEPFALPTGALVLPLPLLIGGIGVVAGAASAGRYSRRYLETGQLPYAAFILTFALALIPHFQHRFVLTALLFVA